MFKGIKKNRKKAAKVFSMVALVIVVASVMSLFAFASMDSYTLSAEMLEPVLEGAAANVGVIVPIGIGLFVIILGVTLIPLVFSKFKRG